MIERLITQLVQQAPELDPTTIAALRDALERDGTPLAQAISRIVELVGEQLVDPGVALPALAEACAALVDPRADAGALAAARYRVDTLEPVPDRPPLAVPDVTVDALRRR